MGCAARKKSKNKTSNYSLSSENGDMGTNGGAPVRTTRGGLRVYKIVILGDGGVGKSGKLCLRDDTVILYMMSLDLRIAAATSRELLTIMHAA